jgi:hypothetical protein
MAEDIRDGEGEKHGAKSGKVSDKQGPSAMEMKAEVHHHVHHHHHEAAHHEHHHGKPHESAGEDGKKVKPSMGERMYDKKKPMRAPMAANEGE